MPMHFLDKNEVQVYRDYILLIKNFNPHCLLRGKVIFHGNADREI